MNVRIEAVCVSADGSEQLAMETPDFLPHSSQTRCERKNP
jgi:hypothetical protein